MATSTACSSTTTHTSSTSTSTSTSKLYSSTTQVQVPSTTSLDAEHNIVLPILSVSPMPVLCQNKWTDHHFFDNW